MEQETIAKILVCMIVLIIISVVVFLFYAFLYSPTMSVVIIDIPPKCLTPKC